MTVVFCNGRFLPEAEATLPYKDRGFLFGDGLFTTVRVHEGTPECLQRHLERLRSHCEALHIQPAEISVQDVRHLIAVNHAQKGTWRLKIVVTGGLSPSLNLEKRRGTVLMFLTPYQEHAADPLTLCLYPDPIDRPLAKFKTLAYADRLCVKEYALQKGFDDALVMTRDGILLESAFANLFWREGDVLYTPRQDLSLIDGIALSVVQDVASLLKMPFKQVLARESDLPKHAQLFLCNSLMGIQPVGRIESQEYPRDRAFEKQLQDQFERQCKESRSSVNVARENSE